MSPFRRRLVRLGVLLLTGVAGIRRRIGGLLGARSSSEGNEGGWLGTLRRRELEAERLDRLREPWNYRGK